MAKSSVMSVDGKYYHAGCLEAEPGDKVEVVNVASLDSDDMCKGCNDPLLSPDDDDDDDDEEEEG